MTVVRLLPALATIITILAIAPAPAADPPKKAEPPAKTKLPQTHEYQRTLYKYMATLTEKDFTHGVTAKVTAGPREADAETLYRTHLLSLMHQPLVGTKRGYPAINAPPGLFVMSAIETPQGVMNMPVWPETLIPFVQYDDPGNPYHNNRALKLRAFVTATIMMVMLDDYFDDEPKAGRADRYAYQLVYFGLPYPGFKDALPKDVQKAYEAGLKRMAERVMAWGIRPEDPQNELHGPFGVACVVRAINDPAFTKAAEAYARPLFEDPKYFRAAGYWNYRGGPDTGFNGHANYFAVLTALAIDWPFAREAVARSYKLRGHLLLPEPDGAVSGPSHFNSRLSGSVAVDQWSWGGARDTAAAMVTDEAAHLAVIPTAAELAEAPAKAASKFADHIRENGVNAKGVFAKNEEIITYPWKPRIWMTYNFPGSVNPGHEFYKAGTFAHLQELQKTNSPMLKSPFARGETFVRDFDKEFVVTRQPGYAAILHTGPVGSQDPADGMRQFVGPLGLGGGQLSAFWTPATGSVLLGQRGGLTNDKTFDTIDAWRTWPIHAVSGSSADGVFFTSARIAKPTTVVNVRGAKAEVNVTGTIPATIVGQEKAIAGKYVYARTFRIDDKGVSVETTVGGDGKEPIAELYETLPVFLRDARTQAKATPTAIAFRVGGKWITATDTFTEKVEAVRLTRFTGAVVVTFEQPRRVKLSPADWADTFLGQGTARNVLIDLLESEKPVPLKEVRKVAYRIEPEK